MVRIIDLTGQIFDQLKVIYLVPKHLWKSRHAYWFCECKCGNKELIITSSDRLKNGKIKSCGCIKKENRFKDLEKAHKKAKNNKYSFKHGESNSRTYKSYRAMRDRCLNSKVSNYKNYGGRGITICERWINFENFLIDMGHRPIGKTLDRINNDGNYEPGNCRWATAMEQNNNKRRLT